MAVIDPRDDSIVIRIVYDGAPMAGKTTSVGTLGRGLGAGVYTPADVQGRTLYFDWLDYTGGLFEGRRIRCQIVTVPGQATLAPRRRLLLESADVVVFVGDSTPDGVAADTTYLDQLQALLRQRTGPPVGIVMQANKRDLQDAVPLDRLREMLDGLGLRVAILESVATEGTGIRETFVFAVRLALDRIRELIRTDELPTMRPSADSGLELLAQMRSDNDAELDRAIAESLGQTAIHALAEESIASIALREAMQAEAPVIALASGSSPNPVPAPPDATVASGLVWPPVDGRMMLHEVSAEPPRIQRADNGDWAGVTPRQWRFHSHESGTFDSLEAGRTALVNWARTHTACNGTLSTDRCITLARDNDRFRLWQIVKLRRTLREQINEAMEKDGETLASTLVTATRSFLAMAESLSSAPCELPLSLDCIATTDSTGSYVGIVPEPDRMGGPRQWKAGDAADALIAQLDPIRRDLQRRRSDLLPALALLARNAVIGRDRPEWPVMQRIVTLTRPD
ncbi:signal recognition particle receptor subunit beta [Povalibacter uvarum]|uniref:Signal recognition particle receptor subunit beta n=1 Tax=Povalibacter uvarum TaxID=732238 RepID=A0A841HL69_9GAMM|nr:GTPase domain-containing protein [Povalibacter uvarum]MBB6093324.1 signal recognition particle receptor subunit beta [Povalibacter uvarum]